MPKHCDCVHNHSWDASGTASVLEEMRGPLALMLIAFSLFNLRVGKFLASISSATGWDRSIYWNTIKPIWNKSLSHYAIRPLSHSVDTLIKLSFKVKIVIRRN